MNRWYKTILSFALTALTTTAFAQNYPLFVGTYTGKGSKGIYWLNFNSQTGVSTLISSTDTASNPSFICVAPSGKYLYAVSEDGNKEHGHISAYAINTKTKSLEFINKVPSNGDHPCFVAINKKANWLVAANYSSGSLASFSVNPNGSINESTQKIVHTGSGPNKQRQASPHVHATFFGPNFTSVWAPDLGSDKIAVYDFNDKTSTPLSNTAAHEIISSPGSGPRHLTFSPNKMFVYVIEELTGTVSAYKVKGTKATFVQNIKTHPENVKSTFGSADIHITPNGKFLYASNRGEENNLAIFSIHPITGKLTNLGYQSVSGIGPRNFTIDPTGQYVLVANQITNNIVTFYINQATGLLKELPTQINIPNPVCLVFNKQ
jgi:6-phosphogluconolactonase